MENRRSEEQLKMKRKAKEDERFVSSRTKQKEISRLQPISATSYVHEISTTNKIYLNTV